MTESTARLRAVKAADNVLVKTVERAINEADPIGLLDLGAPSDEYAPEIETTTGDPVPTGTVLGHLKGQCP